MVRSISCNVTTLKFVEKYPYCVWQPHFCGRMCENLNPCCSKRLRISPTSPSWTPLGLPMMKVRSQKSMSPFIDKPATLVEESLVGLNEFHGNELEAKFAPHFHFISAQSFDSAIKAKRLIFMIRCSFKDLSKSPFISSHWALVRSYHRT